LKRIIYIITFLFIISTAKGQDIIPYALGVQTNVSSDESKIFEQKVAKSLEKLQQKKVRIQGEKQFLKYVFNYLHTNYLKTYQKEADFYDIMTESRYNCVSGNILLAYFLEKTGYQYDIYETENHVFVVVSLSQKDRMLVEITAFYGEGLVDEEEKIDNKIAELKPTGKVSLTNLAGMQFYNEAVLAFQEQKYLESLSLSNKAYYFYPSAKVKTLHSLSKQRLSEQVVAR